MTRDLLVAVWAVGIDYRLEAWCGHTERNIGATLDEALTVAQQHEDTCKECRNA